MTTGTNPDAIPARRRWAAELLEVPEVASPAEARRAYLGKLRECAFLPPRSWRQALRVLEGGSAPAEPDEEWLTEEEARLRAEVETFAEEFFAVPVAQRRERWEALLCRCENMLPLVVRLQALKAGLEVETQGLPLDQSPGGRLVEQLLQTFPLPPLARAASRQAFLRRVEGAEVDSHKLWEKAARYLRAEWPALAALDEELVRHVAELRSRLKQRGKMHYRSQQHRQAAAAAGSKNGNRWWVVLVVISVTSGLLRGFINSNNSSPPRAAWPGPSAPRDSAGLGDIEHLPWRMVTDPKTGVGSVKLNLPPLQELLDPAKYDIEVQGAGSRVFRFTPRLDPTARGSKGLPANNGQPVLVGEATLRLLGVSKEQIDALGSRAAERKPRDHVLKTPPDETDPKRPKSAAGNDSRP